jgi:hypothetical protein
MTVKELIEKLQEANPTWIVEVLGADGKWDEPLGVEIYKQPYGAFTLWRVRIF